MVELIDSILDNTCFNTENCEYTKCEMIENLIFEYGWKEIEEVILSILLNDNRTIDDYIVAAEVLWGAALDKREININQSIALLYYRLSGEDELVANLIWSITCKLKKIDYNSDYNPLNDLDIAKEMPGAL